ncbi:hypothetical protein EG329_009953 [Mollisiaceae sp. DMI_Dod_QoI]|nr:hypothetical protein EG329_009953 [Helotiales sp. DMI_Dod_QoI]
MAQCEDAKRRGGWIAIAGRSWAIWVALLEEAFSTYPRQVYGVVTTGEPRDEVVGLAPAHGEREFEPDAPGLGELRVACTVNAFWSVLWRRGCGTRETHAY